MLRRLVANPTAPLTDPSVLFVDSRMDGLDRLLSHLLIGGLLVPALAVLAPALAVVAAASLYVHVLADLYATVRSVVVFDAEDVPEELRDSP